MISIVDDDVWARSGLGELVLSLEYRVRTFESAEQFVESGNIDETSCLITDLHMPGLGGVDLQSRLRNEGHRIPIIFITAYPTDSDRALAFAGGATCFLVKPIDEQSLIACLALAIEQERSSRAVTAGADFTAAETKA